MKRVQPTAPSNPFAELSDVWISTWVQPWSAWQVWSKLWGENWQRWLDAASSVPTPWLPALAGDRRDQPAAIDFFLPWLPRTDADFGVPAVHDAVSTMLRAAAPAYSLLGKRAELFPGSRNLRAAGDLARTETAPAAKVAAAPAKPPVAPTAAAVAKAPVEPKKAVKPKAPAKPGSVTAASKPVEAKEAAVDAAPTQKAEAAVVAKAPASGSRRAAAKPAEEAGKPAEAAAKPARSRRAKAPKTGTPKAS